VKKTGNNLNERKMPSTIKTRIIRSIAVAIDCSPHSKASLDAAAEMAVRLKAELIGLFVEDINLLKMAVLPFAEEIRPCSTSTGKLDTEELERMLRLQARQANELLQHIAEALRLRYSFRVLRGMVSEQIISAVPEADMLVLGRKGRSPSCRQRLGSTARTALSESTINLLLMRPGITGTNGPLLVLLDASEASKRALAIALQIAGPSSCLHLLVTDPDPAAPERCRHKTASMVETSGIKAEYHHLPFSDGHRLARYIRLIDSGLLVIGKGMTLPAETLYELIEKIDYPVLVVRNG
jgi:nucleotide-binding universal stress UspA family protein